MLKAEYFMLCVNANQLTQRKWIIKAFSLVKETKTEETLDDWELLHTQAGVFFKHGISREIIRLDDVTDFSNPAFHIKDRIALKAGDLINIKEDLETTYGNVIANWCLIVWPFRDAILFKTGKFSVGTIEAEIIKRLVDTPPPEAVRDNQKYLYVDDFIRFMESCSYLMGLNSLFVPSASPKTMTISPHILKRRDELFKIHAHELDNRAVMAKIEGELTDMDRADFKGDIAETYLITDKAFKVVRKKRFIVVGNEASMREDGTTQFIRNSLSDGLDVSKFAEYNNGSRSGSYKRGRETQLGGELGKWLIRASSNSRVVPGSCLTRLGVPTTLTQKNHLDYLGFSIVSEDDYTTLSENNIGTYFTKSVMLRSPQFCKAEKTDYCEICVGPKLAANPDAISVAASAYGSAFMALSMSAMHGKSLTVARFDFENELS